MQTTLSIVLWPIIVICRAVLEVLIWFNPSIAKGRRVFPPEIRDLISSATAIEVHYAEDGSEEKHEPGQIGTPIGFRSLGMVRVESERTRRRIIQSVLKANRECLGGLLCLDVEFALRFETAIGRVEFMICFWCQQVWVKVASNDGQYYPISGRPLTILKGLLRKAGIPEPPASLDHA